MKIPYISEDDYITQFGGEPREADYLDRQIIEEQLQKYYGYVQKGRKNSAYDIAKETLDGVADGLAQGNVNTLSLITEMTEIFNMLQEHGFPMGKAQYPGPGAEWKKLVEQYLH